MKQYISEGRAMYEDYYHGLFSRKLALWAVSKMRVLDPSTGKEKPLSTRTIDDVMEVLAENGVKVSDDYVYTAYYLYNMALADYPRSLATDKQRSAFVEETLFDPDGEPSNVLACFEAKMCNAGIPIYWERMM